MYTPHTVTIYNLIKTDDPTTFEDTITNNITILRGVFLDAVKATNVRQSGLEGADAVTLHIPFDVDARGVDGSPKRYVGAMEFWRADDKSGLWTLSDDQRTFFCKGIVTDDESEEYINMMHDDVYTVTKVDEKDFGSAYMQHWEVGGR